MKTVTLTLTHKQLENIHYALCLAESSHNLYKHYNFAKEAREAREPIKQLVSDIQLNITRVKYYNVDIKEQGEFIPHIGFYNRKDAIGEINSLIGSYNSDNDKFYKRADFKIRVTMEVKI